MKFASDKQSSSDPQSWLCWVSVALEWQGQTQYTKYLLYTFCIHTKVEGFTVIFNYYLLLFLLFNYYLLEIHHWFPRIK